MRDMGNLLWGDGVPDGMRTRKLHNGSETPHTFGLLVKTASLSCSGESLRRRGDLGVGAPRAIGGAVGCAAYACTDMPPPRW